MKVWVYLDGRQQGPYEMEQLRDLPGFNEYTKVWFEGLPKWFPAGSLDELKPIFGGTEQSAASTEPRSAYTPGTVYTSYNPGTAAQPAEPCPPTYIWFSIFLLVCCCTPLGIAAIIASVMVSVYYGRGDLKRAKKASDIAAWLIMVTIALGFIPMMLMSFFQL